MKKTIYTLIAASIIFLIVGLFKYDGATAFYTADPESEAPQESDVLPSTLAEEDDGNIHVTQKATATEEVTIHENTQNTPVQSNEQTNQELIIGNEQYVNMMNEQEFATLRNLATEHTAELYGIPFSDSFAIVKSGEPVFHLSTGAAASLVSNTGMLIDYFTQEEFQGFTGLIDDIKAISKNGGNINKELGHYSSYQIFEEEGWVYVTWF